MFSLILKQAIILAFRKGGGAFGTLAFYLIVWVLFVFASSPEHIQQQAPAVMCVALILAHMIGLPALFERDDEDGTLEQYRIKCPVLEMMVLAKLIGQWLVQLAPILLITPLLGVMAGLDTSLIMRVCVRMLLCSPSVVAIGVMTAALTLGSRRGGLLPALICLPLMVPVVIFASAMDQAASVWILAAFMMVLVPLSCFVSAALLRWQ